MSKKLKILLHLQLVLSFKYGIVAVPYSNCRDPNITYASGLPLTTVNFFCFYFLLMQVDYLNLWVYQKVILS